MTLPFTHDQFLDVLGAYNAALWPVAAALWLASVVVAVQWLRGRAHANSVVVLLVLHWGWSGIAYHAVYFSRINPAAWIFAGLFVVGAVAFGWFGLARGRLTFDIGWTPRHVLACVLVVYALAYPGLALLTGLQWPRTPAFGVPCPTTLFTAGMLLAAAPPVPRWVFVIPIVWAVIGGSAALTLGIAPDFMLFVAALAMLSYAVRPGMLAGARAS
jgi:hypothetical protein